MAEENLVLGIDLGGTNLRVGIVNEHGDLLDFAAKPIDGAQPGEEILADIVGLAGSLPRMEQVKAVGVGLAGMIFPDGVIRKEMVNLPGLDHFPLQRKVAQVFGRPVYLENDAILALVGEHRFGAGRDCDDILLLTLGTGLGGALLLNGVVRRGPHGLGCEVGLLPYPNPDLNNRIDFERLVAPKAIMQRLGDPDGYLYERAASGNAQARRAIEEMYRHLGWLVTALHVVADFRLVILSGGLASVGAPLAAGVEAAFREICPPAVQFDLRVTVGALPAQAAGVLGAAAMCFEAVHPY